MVITNARLALLKILLANPWEEFTIRALSMKAGINYRLSYEEAMKMMKEGMISIKKQGQGSVCRINMKADTSLYAFIESLRSRDFLKRNDKIKIIAEELSKINTALFTAILFGSHAKEKAGKTSDIDILIVAKDHGEIEAEAESILSALSYPIHITSVSEQDFILMKKQQGINVANEIIGNHIILSGPEIYCRMMAK